MIGDAGINFDALSAVVNDQLAKDAKYDRENDAKFRAVRQRVATYEEFENIVIGAHLKPMKECVNLTRPPSPSLVVGSLFNPRQLPAF